MKQSQKDNRIKCISRDWFFTRSDCDEAKDPMYDHSDWRKLDLPHDWSIEGGYDRHAPSGRMGGFVETGVAWYRKVIFIDETLLEMKHTLIFDGVYMKSDVYINGHHLGHRPYGYINFEYELDPWLQAGINVIAVRVDCLDQPSSRWYNGCGIYRHVWMKVTDRLHLADAETVVRTPIAEANGAEVTVDGIIVNTDEVKRDVAILVEIEDDKGDVSAREQLDMNLISSKETFSVKLFIDSPKRWAPESPSLYKCRVNLIKEKDAVDSQTVTFGIRNTEFIAGKGFFLNEKPYKFKGVCLHHSAGVFGAAIPDVIREKRLMMLKNMGCNAVRTAHNPFASEFYDMCDRLGIMVMDEVFDGWEKTKAPYDYGLYFEEWYEKDVEAFIKRDRNHPSIMMWSIGNEVHHMDPVINGKLATLVKRFDDSRPVTCGVQGTGEVSEANRAILDIAGYNDGGGACFIYDRDHSSRPDQLMIATEAPHTYQTRGFYRTQTWWRDKNQPRIEIENLCEEELFFDGHLSYRSSYDNSGVRTCIRDSWSIAENRPFLMGEFRWSGMDYYGESFGWPARNSCSGVIGTDYIEKDSYYLYQSMWSDSPMVHMLPHWTHPHLTPGTPVPVWVYTNCDSAEVFLNGKSHGKKIRGDAKHLQWDVPYEEGHISVIAYKDGSEAASADFETAGSPEGICLEVDPYTAGQEVVQINAYITDASGVMVPSGDSTIHFHVSDRLCLIGTENGDSIDTTPVSSHSRKAFNGICVGMVRSSDESKASGHIYAAGIIGEKVFKERSLITIDFKQLSLESDIASLDVVKQVKINDGPWSDYVDAIEVDETTHIQAKIIVAGHVLFDMTALFTKKEKEKVIDLAHGNRVLNLDVPVGPFSDKMVGLWTDGQFSYRFSEGGLVSRIINQEQEQGIGHWWYDFPFDAFEAQEYAGQGEIWFDSGEHNKIAMITQEANEVKLDNSNGAIGTAYGHSSEITLKRIMESEE